MSNIVGTVLPSPVIKSTIRGLQNAQARTIAIGAPNSLGDLSDIDLTAIADGAVLVYSGTLQKFVAVTEVNNSNTKIIGGSF